jgi:hypothetical protein
MKPIVLEGTLKIWDQEGGHAEPAVEIDDQSLTSVLEASFEHLRSKGAEGIVPPGRYRITLEKIA